MQDPITTGQIPQPTSAPATVADLLWWIVLSGTSGFATLVTIMSKKILSDKEESIKKLEAKIEKLEGMIVACEQKHKETDKLLDEAINQKVRLEMKIEGLQERIDALQRRMPTEGGNRSD